MLFLPGVHRSKGHFQDLAGICSVFFRWHTSQRSQPNEGRSVHKTLEIITLWILGLDPSSVCACPWYHSSRSESGVHLLFLNIQEIRPGKNRPFSRRTWPLNDQIFDSLLPSWMLGSSTLDEAGNSAHFAANISQKKVGIGQYSAFKTCNIVVACLTKTFLSRMSGIQLRWFWIRTSPTIIRHHNDTREFQILIQRHIWKVCI